MFEPRKLRVTYRVEKPAGEAIEFVIRLDEHGLLEWAPEPDPAWIRFGIDRCRGCESGDGICRAARAIVPVVRAFIDCDSLQEVRASAELPNYTATVTCTLPTVVASIMGLTMAASGCPATAPFRAMAIYHQPFATLEETAIRAAGFALLGRWAHGTLAAAEPFALLIEAWSRLEEMNMRIGRALQAYCETDATLNGLANLDMFAKAGAFGLDRALAALKPALLAWDAEAVD